MKDLHNQVNQQKSEAEAARKRAEGLQRSLEEEQDRTREAALMQQKLERERDALIEGLKRLHNENSNLKSKWEGIMNFMRDDGATVPTSKPATEESTIYAMDSCPFFC